MINVKQTRDQIKEWLKENEEEYYGLDRDNASKALWSYEDALDHIEELRKALGEVLETFQIHERFAKISDHQGNKHYLDDEDFQKIKKSWELLNPRKEEPQ